MLIIAGPLPLIIGHIYSPKYYVLIQPDQSSPLLLRNLLPISLDFTLSPAPIPLMDHPGLIMGTPHMGIYIGRGNYTYKVNLGNQLH